MATATKTKANPAAAAYAAEMKALETKLGKDIIHPASVMPRVYKLPFVNPHMNYATEGGAPWDRLMALYGDESCLAGSTWLKYQVYGPDGKRRDTKGGTLERLYERFNNVLLRPGKGRYLRREDSTFYLPSVDEEGKVVKNIVVDVLKTGVKDCIRIKTAGGLVVETTADHQFMTPDGFCEAGSLVVGQIVTVHDGTRQKGRSARQRRPETTVKHHGTASRKMVNGQSYHRLKQAQLVLEADMNGLSVETYRGLLNNGDLSGLRFIDTADVHVHHLDEDPLNDQPLNLTTITPQDHGRHHALRSQRNLSFIAVEQEIVSIEPVGQRETYDVKMASPYNNFVADGFVVHNCGKTLCALELVAQGQNLPHSAERILIPRIKYHKEMGDIVLVAQLEEELEWVRETFPDGARCAWHDIEGQFDKIRAQKLGVDTDALHMSEEQVIENFGYLLPFGHRHFHIQVLDSTSAASSMLKLKQAPGQSAGYGIDARQWKDILRTTQMNFGSTKNGMGIPNLTVMIHQMSTNIKTGGGQAMTTRYMRHASSLSIKFTRGMFLWDKDGVLKDGKETGADENSMAGLAEPDGLEVFIKIEKSRTCRPFKTGGMQFDYRTLRYSDIHELASSGLYFGFIIKSGSWFSIPGEEKNLGQGMKAVYARLADDGDLRDKILARLLDHTRDIS